MLDLNKLSRFGRIGIPESAFIVKEKPKIGPHCDIKLKPPKYPKNPDKSKKVYKGIFIRSMKPFKALYHIEENIYIVSLHDQIDVYSWIDKNEKKITERIENARRNIIPDFTSSNSK